MEIKIQLKDEESFSKFTLIKRRVFFEILGNVHSYTIKASQHPLRVGVNLTKMDPKQCSSLCYPNPLVVEAQKGGIEIK